MLPLTPGASGLSHVGRYRGRDRWGHAALACSLPLVIIEVFRCLAWRYRSSHINTFATPSLSLAQTTVPHCERPSLARRPRPHDGAVPVQTRYMERGLRLVREGYCDSVALHRVGAPRAWSDRVCPPSLRTSGLCHAAALSVPCSDRTATPFQRAQLPQLCARSTDTVMRIDRHHHPVRTRMAAAGGSIDTPWRSESA